MLTPFLSKNGVKCYLISILRPDSEPSCQGASFRHQNERGWKKTLFLTPHSNFKFLVARGWVGIIFFREMKHANLLPEIQGTMKSQEHYALGCITIRDWLEASFGFGFSFRKPGFSRKCWLPGRLRLPSFQKSLAAASASASLNAVFDGIGFSFGFVIFFYGRLWPRLRLQEIVCLASAVQ